MTLKTLLAPVMRDLQDFSVRSIGRARSGSKSSRRQRVSSPIRDRSLVPQCDAVLECGRAAVVEIQNDFPHLSRSA